MSSLTGKEEAAFGPDFRVMGMVNGFTCRVLQAYLAHRSRGATLPKLDWISDRIEGVFDVDTLTMGLAVTAETMLPVHRKFQRWNFAPRGRSPLGTPSEARVE